MKISVIIPAKNEGEGIDKIIKVAKLYADEVLVIDGHSSDKTVQVARRCGVKVYLDNGKGKGSGLRTGIKKAKGDILVFIDADGSHNPHDISKMVKPIIGGKADLVLGSRAKGGSDEVAMNFDGFFRQIGSEIAAIIVNWRWKANLTDIQNGFRAIKKDLALSLKLESDGFEIEEEMVMKCLRKRAVIIEVSSHEYSRKWGVSKLSTSQCWRFLIRLLKEVTTK